MSKFALAAVLLLATITRESGSITGTITCHGADSCTAVVYATPSEKKKVSPPQRPAVLDQVNLTFVPHVLPIVVGTTVAFPNHDDVPHNVFSFSATKIFNLGVYPSGESRYVTFDKAGEVAVLCNLHPHMLAYVLVLEEPHFTIAANNGSFRLTGLPPGKYTVTAWHERYKSVSQQVEIKSRQDIALKIELSEHR